MYLALEGLGRDSFKFGVLKSQLDKVTCKSRLNKTSQLFCPSLTGPHKEEEREVRESRGN